MVSGGRKFGKSQTAFCNLTIEARKSTGLTQQDLAARLSRPQSFIAKYEGGERRIDVVEFIAICRAISVDSSAVLRKLTKLV
jgi:transcriptional regulator with XRE-family HTH domain